LGQVAADLVEDSSRLSVAGGFREGIGEEPHAT
jgi:hypothetical protein